MEVLRPKADILARRTGLLLLFLFGGLLRITPGRHKRGQDLLAGEPHKTSSPSLACAVPAGVMLL
jgi:hypothetical protein